MDPRVAGAGVAMTVGMLLLLPTFNALNNSYTTDVAPPEWLAKFIDPESLPDDFQPPEDMELPEDYEIPEDMELPPGWEIPPDYDGPIPPGGCPPPVPVWFASLNGTKTLPSQAEHTDSKNFVVPDFTVAVVANVTFNDWQARSVLARLVPADGETLEESEPGSTGGLLVPAQSVRETPFTFQMIAESETQRPPPGRYTIEIEVDLPISGSYSMSALAVLACGGNLS